MTITLTQLRAFHALAITKRFTTAAERLHVSQPAITAQIKSLEEDHGVALFNRQGHTITLSGTGEILFDISNSILRLFDEAGEVLTSESELRSGTVRIGSDNPFFIMEVLAVFKARYPDMTVKVVMGSASEIFGELNRYDIDVAIVTAQDAPDKFVAEPFSRLSLMLLLPLDHPWTDRSSVSLEEISEQPIVMREPSSTTRTSFVESLTAIGRSPNVILELNSQVAVREAVSSGLGISVELDGGLIPSKRLKLVPISNAPVVVQEYVVCRRDRQDLHKVRAFFEIAQEIAPIRRRTQQMVKRKKYNRR